MSAKLSFVLIFNLFVLFAEFIPLRAIMGVSRDRTWMTNFAPDAILLVFRISESMLEPSVVMYMYHSICLREYNSDMSICRDLKDHPDEEDHVQQLASSYIVAYRLLWNFPALFLALFCGAWTDRVGRRFSVVWPCLGTALAVMLYLISTLEPMSLFPMALCGAAVRGAFGGTAIVLMGVQSYVSDISSDEGRTSRLGILLAMNYFGNVIGFSMMGALLISFGFEVVFCVVMALQLICIVGALFFLVDTRNLTIEYKEQTSRFLFSTSHVKDSINVMFRKRDNNKRTHLWLLLLTVIINQIGREGEGDILLLYVSRRPLNWDRSLYGFLAATDFACMGLLVCLLLPVLSYKFKINDAMLAVCGIVAKMFRLLLLAFASSTWVVFVAVIGGTPIAIAISAVKSLMSKTVERDEIGKVFSMTSCGETLSSLVGALAFNELYSAVASFFPGLPFLLNSLLYIFLLLTLSILVKDINASAQYDTLDEGDCGSLGGDNLSHGAGSEVSISMEVCGTKEPPVKPQMEKEITLLGKEPNHLAKYGATLSFTQAPSGNDFIKKCQEDVTAANSVK